MTPKTEVKQEGHVFRSGSSSSNAPPPKAPRFAAKKTSGVKKANAAKSKKKPVKRRERSVAQNFPGKTAVVNAASAPAFGTREDVVVEDSSSEVVEIDSDDDDVEIICEQPASVESKPKIQRVSDTPSDQTVASSIVAAAPTNPLPISSRSPSVSTPPIASSPVLASATLESLAPLALAMMSPKKAVPGIRKVPKMSPRRSDLPPSLYQNRPRTNLSGSPSASNGKPADIVTGQGTDDRAGGLTDGVPQKPNDSLPQNPGSDKAEDPTTAAITDIDAMISHVTDPERRVVKVLVNEAQLEALRSLGIQILE